MCESRLKVGRPLNCWTLPVLMFKTWFEPSTRTRIRDAAGVQSFVRDASIAVAINYNEFPIQFVSLWCILWCMINSNSMHGGWSIVTYLGHDAARLCVVCTFVSFPVTTWWPFLSPTFRDINYIYQYQMTDRWIACRLLLREIYASATWPRPSLLATSCRLLKRAWIPTCESLSTRLNRKKTHSGNREI